LQQKDGRCSYFHVAPPFLLGYYKHHDWCTRFYMSAQNSIGDAAWWVPR
jgi:hypothetical protein